MTRFTINKTDDKPLKMFGLINIFYVHTNTDFVNICSNFSFNKKIKV